MAVDLTTRYLGLTLANPLVVAACPLAGEMDVLRRLEQYGAAAAVMPSLFEEQFERVPEPNQPAAPGVAFAETVPHFQQLKEYNRGPDIYLKHVAAAKKALSIPIIGSLNVMAVGEWIHYAARIQDAGADALELNIYFLATDPDTTSRDIEARYIEIVTAVRSQVSIPLSVKIGPYFTALPNVARRIVEAGADGLVLFNRFLQPDIDLPTMRVLPRLMLSTPDEIRLPLRWIALLYGRLQASMAASGGAHGVDDIIKLLLAGADVVMVASTLYLHGADVLGTLVNGIRDWLEANEYRSVEELRGSLSQRKCPDPAALERANYTKALASVLNRP